MKKLLVIASVLCLPLAITSCGGDEKDGDKDKDSKKGGATGNEEEVAEITCHCLEEALAGETDAANISDEQANEFKQAYLDCLEPFKDELKGKQINNNVMMEKVKEACPDAAAILQDLKNR